MQFLLGNIYSIMIILSTYLSFLLGPLMHDTQYSDNEYVPIVCKSFSKEKKKLIKLCNTNSLILKNFKIQRIRKHKHN